MSIVGSTLLIAAGVVAFVLVAYLPDLVATTDGAQAAVAVTLRLSGFGLLLAAGYLLVRRRARD